MYFVYNSMLIINSPRPMSRKGVFQWLRFSDAIIWASGNTFNEKVYAFKNFLICFLPAEVVFPCIFRKNKLHSMSSLAVPLPPSSSAIDSRSLRAFFGLLRKISPHTSKLATFSAFSSINTRRGSTWSPIRVVNIWSAAIASSIVTTNMRRTSGSMVVSHS